MSRLNHLVYAIALAFIFAMLISVQSFEYKELKSRIDDLSIEVNAIKEQIQVNKPAAAVSKQKTIAPVVKEEPVATNKQLTLAEKNCNPMNVKVWNNSPNYWEGQIGIDKFGHAIFSSQEYGIRAASLTLRSYSRKHNIQTLEGLVARFCKASAKKRAAYVKFLSERIGVGKNEKIDFVAYMPQLLSAIAKYESGTDLDPKHVAAYDILAKL